jgi:hypothetical protein
MYEHALIEGINNIYPDKHWSDVTNCNIQQTLLENNNDVEKTITKILMEAGEQSAPPKKPGSKKGKPKPLNESVKPLKEDIDDSNKDQCEVMLMELIQSVRRISGRLGSLQKYYNDLTGAGSNDQDYSELVNDLTKFKLKVDKYFDQDFEESCDNKKLKEEKELSDNEVFKRCKSGMSLEQAMNPKFN